MKKISMKNCAAVLGFLLLMFVFAMVPGTKSEAATLKNGAVGPVTATKAGEYHKLTMPKDGFVTISLLSYDTSDTYKSACYMTAFNKSKKRISEKKYISFYSKYSQQQAAVFAVKRGTYYIKVEMNYPQISVYNGSSYVTQANQYAIGTEITYCTDQGGTKKSKATTIKLKKSKKGIVALTDAAGTTKNSKGDWYKFKLTKKTKVRLYTVALSTNRSSTQESLSLSVQGRASYSQLSKLAQGKTATLPKGTYYIKVYKRTKTDSGYYMIGLNKKVK